MELIPALEEARAAEKEQALFYRSLAALAEDGDPTLSERLNELHADEQHHVSRLTARLIELGAELGDLSGLATASGPLERWEADARIREHAEVLRYERLLEMAADPRTRAVLEEILDTERHHAEELGGKWTNA